MAAKSSNSMTIDNHDEFEAAEGWLKDAESVANRIWNLMHPQAIAPKSFHGYDSHRTWAGQIWDQTREIVRDLTGRDPDEILEAMEDFLGRYPESDWAGEAKAYALAMEA